MTDRRRWLDRTVGGALIALSALAIGLAGFVSPRAVLRSPEPTLMLLDRDGAFLGEVGEGADERLGFWPATTEAGLPDRVVAATIAIEDRRFYEHAGVDVRAVARAVRQNAAAGTTVSGASTLAMQVARLQDPGPRTVPRKVVEAATAWMLVARYGREAVLAHYLRLAPYGNNVHGVAYAARRYFGKPVQDLSWAETAFLCALPQAPGTMNPYDRAGRRRAAARAERILALVHAQGLMSDADLVRAQDELGRLAFLRRPERPASAVHAVLSLEAALSAPEARAVHRDHPLVSTTLDLEVQDAVQALLAGAVHEWEARGAGNAAAMVVELDGARVVASVGSTDFFDPRFAGSIDYTMAPRQPGSTLKPFVYGAALDRDVITPATILDDLRRGPDGIADADDRFLGPLLPRHALANSRNVPAVELASAVGLDQSYALFHDLGLHDDTLPVGHYGHAVAIGGMPTTLRALTQAYTAVALDGAVHPLVWTTADHPAPGRQVFTPETARLLTLFLSDPIARLPSFPRGGNSELPFPAAFKTGTSSDFRDAWAVAWSPRYLVAVWVGHPDWTPMRGLSGYRAGALLAKETLRLLHPDDADGMRDVGFPPPAGYVPVPVCALTGKQATEACDRVVTEHFSPDDAPHDDCPAHVRRVVDARTGALATAETPPRYAQTRTFVDLPPRYAAWADAAGLERVPGALGPVGDAPISVRIVAPADGVRVMRDPEAPAGTGTIPLQAAVEGPVAQVVWYVDGEPFAIAQHPWVTRWEITPGTHTFEARVPYVDATSQTVRVIAR